MLLKILKILFISQKAITLVAYVYAIAQRTAIRTSDVLTLSQIINRLMSFIVYLPKWDAPHLSFSS